MYRRKVPKLSTNVNKPFKKLIEEPHPTANSEKPLKDIDANKHANQTTRFGALYRKTSTKAHKTWDGDGTVLHEGETVMLKDIDSKKILGRSHKPTLPFEGEELRIGQYEVLIEEMIQTNAPMQTANNEGAALVRTTEKRDFAATPAKKFKTAKPLISAALRSSLDRKEPAKLVLTEQAISKEAEPIVLPRPKNAESNVPVADVTIDPLLAQYLKPHQVDAVKFLYRCVMGMKDYTGRGALLADAMGLGKTLTTIALLWTLLKQSPIPGHSVIERALIVCPVSLIDNWLKEFNKWLGKNNRMGIFVADSRKTIRENFGNAKSGSQYIYQVMIIGYERLRSVSAELQECHFDIVVCDEGHRLKTAGNKSAQAILQLDTDRRIILSGTPIQNDLGEFFTMVNFLNPGIIGSYNSFKRDYEIPITRARQLGASPSDVELGEKRASQLSVLTRQFVLRRSEKILEKYLPLKTETIVFCKPTRSQCEDFQKLSDSGSIDTWLNSTDPSQHLKSILHLRQICNSSLVANGQIEFSRHGTIVPYSGKTVVLEQMLEYWYHQTTEKVVLVSNYTKTLDLLECFISQKSYKFVRLDGRTPANKRQMLVDRFNRNTRDHSFIFLLSTKSGGVGLNLIGASRLVLFDTDWNPSVDRQAMARIHRQGQQNPVHIYRLLIAGAIDEKIFQRQVTKQGLADRFLDGSVGQTERTDAFTYSELKDLFTFRGDTVSNTHDLLGCKCFETETAADNERSYIKTEGSNQTGSQNDGSQWISASEFLSSQQARDEKDTKDSMKGLSEYEHVNLAKAQDIEDGALREGITKSTITCAFIKKFRSEFEDTRNEQ